MLDLREVLRVLHFVDDLLTLETLYLLVAHLHSLRPQLITLLQITHPCAQQLLHLPQQIEDTKQIGFCHL